MCTLWITGGYDEDAGRFKTTELVSLHEDGQVNSIVMGPDMPIGASRHCIASLSDSEFIFLGGDFKKQTKIYDFITSKWTDGKPMTVPRNAFACGMIKSGGKR